MKKLGIKHSYYLPLAANVDRIGAVDIKKREEKKLRCEVSFIGQLYKGVQYQQIYDRAQKSTVKRVDEVIKEAFGRWDGINRIYNSLSEEIIEELNQIYGESPLEKYNMDNHMYYENMLITRETAQKERIEMLKRLSKYDLRFYTSDDDIEIPGVKSLPKVEYGEELPKLYYMSKINLNCTLHSIESGIPQRVFDVLAAGGFLLTNYQPELEELFTIGRDLVVYHDFDEMEEKVDYYLHHEKERVRISINGYQKVKERYTYEIQLKKIMNIMERDYGLQKKKMEQWKRI
jgi:spore maturation protein CgeB